ncbi:MAG: hypothetical protein WCS37_07400 [Chloroflexota bacterium]|nr:hypothetical protein [Chloroflexota bacterium]
MSSEASEKINFRIELRLKPAEAGERELKNWPAVNFTPDFAVAASGVVRIELAGQMIGAKDGKLMSVETRFAQRLQQDINFWLPDYIGGFALNLGRALQILRDGKSLSKASFVDEPMVLQFRRQPSKGSILVGFEAEGKSIRAAEITEKTLYAEVSRALQTFRRQLLELNPELARQQDVLELTQQIQKLGV